MSLTDILKGVGKLQGLLEKSGVHVSIIDEAAKVADQLVKHVASHPATGLTAEQAREQIEAGRLELLAAGDEAAARIAARQAQDDGA